MLEYFIEGALTVFLPAVVGVAWMVWRAPI